jgi:hypothetical protein
MQVLCEYLGAHIYIFCDCLFFKWVWQY